MHHYQFHPGDYMLDTSHLSPMEDLAYRRLLDLYYGSEKPIPLETQSVSRRIRMDTKDVESVLNEFFKQTHDGWRHGRCDAVIADYQARCQVNKINGKGGGRPKKTHSVSSRNPSESVLNPNGKATINHKPETNNQTKTCATSSLANVAELPQDEEDFWTQGLTETQTPSRPDPGASAATKKAARAWTPTPQQIQVAGWFGRRPTTHWDERELRAWKALRMEEEDMEILDWFYMRSGYQYLRRDLKALLNNWRGEVDKARNYNPEKENDRR